MSRSARKIGFLLRPLGWVVERLRDAIDKEPGLLRLLVELDVTKMHLIALALAHRDGEVSCEFAHLLLQGNQKAVTQLCVRHQLNGLRRALRQLPPKVLPPVTYRQLIDLLHDRATARFMHHSSRINERAIAALHGLPQPLRTPTILKMFDRFEIMNSFVDGLEYLAIRTNFPINAIVNELGALQQPNQIIARIRNLIEALPLPKTIPPAKIGSFERIDCTSKIRALAKSWHNCLAGYIQEINNGSSVVYLSEELKAVCLLSRCGRLGWFVADIKGPRNTSVKAQSMVEILGTFSTAGFLLSERAALLRAITYDSLWAHLPDDGPDFEPFEADVAA